MKHKWVGLFAVMSLVLPLLASCATPTPTGLTPSPVPPTQAPTSIPPTGAAGSPKPTPNLLDREEPLTVKGTLDSGVTWGVTAAGHYFMGEPDAPILFVEFSDYQ